jgi:murein DD-endopeptidase MepM/ murein hydrolase activator NlpD
MAGPNLTIAVEPMESSSIVCGQLAAKTSNDFPQGQLSLVLTITNNEAVAVHLNKVSISFLGPPKVPTSAIAADLTIGATEAKKWYFAPADNIILPLPPPGSIKLDLWCDAFANPATLTLALAPYVSQAGGGGYLFPAKTDDLKTTEYWFGVSAKHGAAGDGTQLFAYDMTVQGFDDVQQQWTAALPGTAGIKNEDFRVWGKPIYAMAEGTIVQFKNDMPNNTALGPQIPTPDPVEGNHFYIQHGNDLALYAHFQPGSLNAALLSEGAIVNEGDFLGLAGNSGNSTGPHLHIQVNRTTLPWAGPPRPLPFRNVHVLESGIVTAAPWPPNSSAPWSAVTGQDLPSVWSAIWPAPLAINWQLYAGPLAWAWIIIVGGLMVTPGGVDCIACGPIGTVILGIISITIGVAGFVLQALGRRAGLLRGPAVRIDLEGDMHS